MFTSLLITATIWSHRSGTYSQVGGREVRMVRMLDKSKWYSFLTVNAILPFILGTKFIKYLSLLKFGTLFVRYRATKTVFCETFNRSFHL